MVHDSNIYILSQRTFGFWPVKASVILSLMLEQQDELLYERFLVV